MNTTPPSDALLSRPSQMALAHFCALRAVHFLLYIAKILQHAETWILSALDAPTHTIYRVFPPNDISNYTRVSAQLQGLVTLAVLIFCHLRGYLGPYPILKTEDFDDWHWLAWALFRGIRSIRYVFSYMRIPVVIAYRHAASDQFEADGDVYQLYLRLAPLFLIISI